MSIFRRSCAVHLIEEYKDRLHIEHFHAKRLEEVPHRLVALGFPKESLTLLPSGIASWQYLQYWALNVLPPSMMMRDYPSRVLEHVGKPRMHGIAGRYRYEGGKTLVHDRFANTENPSLFQRKQAYQNEVYRKIEDSKERITDTPRVLGGNMVFSRRLFMHVSFDPFVRRGEDIDYMANFQWMCDKMLMIDH